MLSQNPIHKSPLEFADIVVRALTSRDITHQIVRHRMASYLQESQRFVRHTNGNMVFIDPLWKNRYPEAYKVWQGQMEEAETTYAMMVDGYNMQPQEARSVLPNSTGSLICMKKNFIGWRETIATRIEPGSQPEMRSLMGGILVAMYERFQVMFEDLMERLPTDIPLAKLSPVSLVADHECA